MSSWISASSSPKRNSASVLDSHVLPTPDGPAKMNEPPGRLGSFSPARVRRMARLSAPTPWSWPITRLWSSSSILSSRVDSSSESFTIGIPVATASTSAISSSSTSATSSRSPARHCFSRSSLFAVSCFSSSRSRAAASKSWPSIAASLRCRTSEILSSYSRRSAGAAPPGLPRAGGPRHPADPRTRAGLVDEVDGLVGQEPVGDVAVRQGRCRDERLVGDGDAVVGLVAVAEPLQHLDRVGDRGLGDLDRLEAALERCVLLEVLAVLVERGRTDRLQLASSQHRLEDGGRVGRALGRHRGGQGGG